MFLAARQEPSRQASSSRQPFFNRLLTAWLVRLGISISHGRPYHSQTQGNDKRFHRTLAAEVLRDRSFSDLLDTQQAFDPWRQVYNVASGL